MEKGLDTGDILLKREIPVEPKETGESLYGKLMALGAELVVEALPLIESGKITPQKQDDSASSYAPRLTKEMGCIDWSKDAHELERLVRGLNSWPSAYTKWKGKTLKIWEADVVQGQGNSPGRVEQVGKDFLDVACGEGILRIYSLQLEGKKRMAVKDFLLGNEVDAGMVMGG